MSASHRRRTTRRYEFYRDGFRVMLPVFSVLVVIATALAVSLSLTVFKDRPQAAYAVENGSITPLPVYTDPRDPRLHAPVSDAVEAATSAQAHQN